MNDSSQNITDHESILLLRQDVKVLRDEMHDGFKTLKDNYSDRIGKLESDVKDLNEKTRYLPLITKVVFSTAGFILIGVLGAIMVLIIPHFYTR
jgi:hypothetical protein